MTKGGDSTTDKVLLVIKVVAKIVYSAISLYAAISAYKGLPSKITEFEDLLTNWLSKPFTDVEIAATCSAGYEPLYSDSWPGTSAGCYSFPNLKQGVCKSSDFSSFFGARDIPAVPAQSIKYWGLKNGFNSTICIKRTSESWASNAIKTTNGGCPTGYKQCGTSTEMIFCTKETVCPVTRITIAQGASTDCNSVSDCIIFEAPGPVTSNFVTTTTPVTKVLRFYREENTLPLTEFRINEPAYSFSTGDRFSLLQYLPDKLRSTTWSFYDQITENELFRMNNFFYTIQNQLSNNNTDLSKSYYGVYEGEAAGNNRYWQIIGRPYTEWKTTCRDNMNSLVDKLGFGDSLTRVQLALLVITIISFTVLVVIVPCTQVITMQAKPHIKAKVSKGSVISEYFFQFASVPIKIWAVAATVSTRNLFVTVSKNSCSTVEVNSNISFLADQLKGTVDSNIIAMATLFGKLLLDLIIHLYKRHKNKRTQVTSA